MFIWESSEDRNKQHEPRKNTQVDRSSWDLSPARIRPLRSGRLRGNEIRDLLTDLYSTEETAQGWVASPAIVMKFEARDKDRSFKAIYREADIPPLYLARRPQDERWFKSYQCRNLAMASSARDWE